MKTNRKAVNKAVRLVLCWTLLLAAVVNARAQGTPDQADRLGLKMDELIEMLTLSQRYAYTDFLRYHIATETVDSAAPAVILQQDTGSYKMLENSFWGMEGTTEYVQEGAYYLEVSHNDQRVFIYNALNHPRVLQIPLSDSLFNQQYLYDLDMARPGGLLKKLTIHYLPEAPYRRLEITYDSTNYDLKEVKYYYRSMHISDGYETCQHLTNTLVVPASGTSKPAELSCAEIERVYRNFIAEFPNRTHGAVVNMYLPPAAPEGMALRGGGGAGGTVHIDGPPLPDTAVKKAAAKMSLLSLEEETGRWVDSSLTARELFEWYMNTHLGYSGYTGENYIDWLVNDCSYTLYQLPWSEEVFVRADTLQDIWDRFSTAYSPALLSITGTVEVPVVKGLHLASNETAAYYTDDRLQGMVWTADGDWFISHTTNVFDVSVLPRNATVNTASMSMWAKVDPWVTAAHYRQETDTIKLRAVQVKGNYLPDVTNYSTEPQPFAGGALYDFHYSTVPIAPGWDFWSNEDYLGEDVKPLVEGVIHSLDSIGVNYPLQYRIDTEETVNYKRYVFYGTWDPGGHSIALEVNYTAPREEVFTAYVNAALGTYLTFAEIRQMYALYGSLVINATATSASSGPGCSGESAVDFTAIRTISFSDRSDDEFDPSVFGASRFVRVKDGVFLPSAGYAGYEVINMSTIKFPSPTNK